MSCLSSEVPQTLYNFFSPRNLAMEEDEMLKLFEAILINDKRKFVNTIENSKPTSAMLRKTYPVVIDGQVTNFSLLCAGALFNREEIVTYLLGMVGLNNNKLNLSNPLYIAWQLGSYDTLRSLWKHAIHPYNVGVYSENKMESFYKMVLTYGDHEAESIIENRIGFLSKIIDQFSIRFFNSLSVNSRQESFVEFQGVREELAAKREHFSTCYKEANFREKKDFCWGAQCTIVPRELLKEFEDSFNVFPEKWL